MDEPMYIKNIFQAAILLDCIYEYIYIYIVADNYLEPRFEKISKKIRKWHGVLSANLEPETKTTGF